MYAVLMIDIKKSRSYSIHDREQIQNYIIKTCHILNKIFWYGIEREVEFSAGDEIQGLFKDEGAAYLYFRFFSMLIHPIKIRAGIGCGTWDIKINNKGTTAQDGRSYHNARKAIYEVSGQEGYSVLLYSERRMDETVNSMINATVELSNKMSIYQNEMMVLTEMLYPITNDSYMDFAMLGNIIGLMKFKTSLYAKFNEKMNKRIFLELDDNSIKNIIEPVDIRKTEEAQFYVTSGKTRGIPTKLSGIMQISRQSIDRTLKSSSIFVARNTAISILKLLSSDFRRV